MSRHALPLPLSALLLPALLLPTAAARGADYALDEAHVSCVFSVSHMGFSYTYGMFRKVSGAFAFDKDQPEASRFQLAIDVDSIDTMNAKRDEHLKTPDFFDAEKFPQITFTSKKVEAGPAIGGRPSLNVTGDLTMHGVTKEVTLPLQHLGEGPGPMGGTQCGFLCQTTLKRSDFGMANMVGPIGDSIGVTVSFEGNHK